MGFVLVVSIIVIAGWIYMAGSAKTGVAARTVDGGIDDYVPVNAYDNPYDTNESNDRPFEPASSSDDSCIDSNDTCAND